MKWWVNAVLVVGVGVCLLAVSACGGSSDGTSSAEGTSSTTTSSVDKGGEPSSDFVGKGKNGTLAKQGKESSDADRKAASEVLEENFEARAARDWAGQCASLTAETIKVVEKEAASRGSTKKGCVSTLESVGEEAPESVLENPMDEPVAVLRVRGGEGFAFFHGADGKDYVMPMEKEAGEWKVSGLAPQTAP